MQDSSNVKLCECGVSQVQNAKTVTIFAVKNGGKTMHKIYIDSPVFAQDELYYYCVENGQRVVYSKRFYWK